LAKNNLKNPNKQFLSTKVCKPQKIWISTKIGQKWISFSLGVRTQYNKSLDEKNAKFPSWVSITKVHLIYKSKCGVCLSVRLSVRLW
jgi:hypothetical protein